MNCSGCQHENRAGVKFCEERAASGESMCGLWRSALPDREIPPRVRSLDGSGAERSDVSGCARGKPHADAPRRARLFHEFTRSHRVHGWLVLEPESVSYGKTASFVPVIELLRDYFEIDAGSDAGRIREKITRNTNGELDERPDRLAAAVPVARFLLESGRGRSEGVPAREPIPTGDT